MTSPASYLAAAALSALNGTGTFIRQSAEQAELTAQTAPTPHIVLYDYTTSQASTFGRTEGAAITLYFADARPGNTDDAAQHHAAVERMTLLKRRFLAALDASPFVQVDAMRATPFANFTSSQLDGVGCQFTLTVPAGSLVVACL